MAPLSDLHDRAKREHVGLSVNDVLIAAAAAALVEHPQINVSFDEDAIIQHSEVNIGVAVALTEGLVAPAIRRADRLSLAELKAERRRLTEAAHAGRLTSREVDSATFTISNLGTVGVSRFRALVVPPQAAILAVGGIMPDQTMSLTLSCDHRAIDGLPAARFLSSIVRRLEECAWIEGTL